MAENKKIDLKNTEDMESPLTGSSKNESDTIKKTVQVFCKIPNGVTFRLNSGETVTLKGASAKDNILGYGVTKVDAELWEEIKRVYKQHPALNPLKQIIYDAPDIAYGEAKAKEGGARTKMERLSRKELELYGAEEDTDFKKARR